MIHVIYTFASLVPALWIFVVCFPMHPHVIVKTHEFIIILYIETYVIVTIVTYVMLTIVQLQNLIVTNCLKISIIFQ